MRNILFLICCLLISFNSLYGQERCDTVRTDVFVITEEPPISNITFDELENLLNVNIKSDDFEKPQGNMIYLTFIINCRGETFDYKFLRPVDKKLQDKLLEVLNTNLKWKPARHNGKGVDFAKTISIKIEKNGKFNVLDEKELRKINRN